VFLQLNEVSIPFHALVIVWTAYNLTLTGDTNVFSLYVVITVYFVFRKNMV